MTSIVAQLANERRFVMARLEPKPDGGTDKIPTCPFTGTNIDAQDSANWLTGEDAEHYAAVWRASKLVPVIDYGVGFVIAEGSGYFCVDLDHAREGDGWKPHVSNFLGRFPGAYVEVSQSYEGLHVIGRCTDPPEHRTRNADFGAEAYSRLRFIYVTGLGAYGDPKADMTPQFKLFAGQFFPPVAHGSADWSDGPCDAWSGPTDDAELIDRAMRSNSGKALMGRGASFRDLWTGNELKIGADASGRDQGLANHLAFWTGNDCERMQRLMVQSGLKRDKWDRPDYLPRTIMRACSDQREWYNDGSGGLPAPEIAQASKAPAPPDQTVTIEYVGVPAGTPPWVPPVDDAEIILKPGERPNLGGASNYLTLLAQQQIFEGMCYVMDIQRIQTIDGTVMAERQFNAMYGGFQWAVTTDGQRPSKHAWEAFIDNECYAFPRAATQFFKPGVPTGALRTHEGQIQINSYKVMDIRRVQGDPEPFLEFIAKLVPDANDRRILLTWCASLVRNLGVKFMWGPFIQGTKGNGKTTLGKILQYCISHRYTHWPKSDQLSEKFNAVFTDKILLVCDETKTADQAELQETLKILMTSDRLEVRPMYAEKTMKEVCFNIIMFSNHKNGVRIDKDERRFAPFYCAQQTKADNARDGLTQDYFVSHLLPWLRADGYAIIYDYLMSYDIAAEYDPAGACVVAPDTTSTEEAITASLGGIEQEILKAVENRVDGFRAGWISSVAVDQLLARIGKDKSIPPNARKALITSCGYEPHPALPDGLCDCGWTDGTVPRLYVAKGHPWALDYLTPLQVRDGFVAAQRG